MTAEQYKALAAEFRGKAHNVCGQVAAIVSFAQQRRKNICATVETAFVPLCRSRCRPYRGVDRMMDPS
jgi:hypothetical protein